MKAIITVKRTTEYSSIVEMEREEFDRLNAALDSGTHDECQKAEHKLNKLIDPDDWQGDELDSVEQFEEYKD